MIGLILIKDKSMLIVMNISDAKNQALKKLENIMFHPMLYQDTRITVDT